MCNASLAEFLPLTITIGDEGLPSVETLRGQLIDLCPSAAGLTQEAWGHVREALAGVTRIPELLTAGSKIILERTTGVSAWQGEMPLAQRPLSVRIITPTQKEPAVA